MFYNSIISADLLFICFCSEFSNVFSEKQDCQAAIIRLEKVRFLEWELSKGKKKNDRNQLQKGRKCIFGKWFRGVEFYSSKPT